MMYKFNEEKLHVLYLLELKNSSWITDKLEAPYEKPWRRN